MAEIRKSKTVDCLGVSGCICNVSDTCVSTLSQDWHYNNGNSNEENLTELKYKLYYVIKKQFKTKE